MVKISGKNLETEYEWMGYQTQIKRKREDDCPECITPGKHKW